MDPENTTTDTTAAPIAAPTDQPASPPAEAKPVVASFTQEDVNRIVAKRLEEDRARRPAAAPEPKPAAKSSAKPSVEVDLRAELEEMKRQQTELMQRLDYTNRSAKLGLDETKAAALFKVYQANPDGFDEVVNALGIKASQSAAPAATTPVTQPPQPQPNGHPISDKGSPAPGGVVNWEREFAENPLGMSAAARSAMDAKYGRDKAIKMRLEASQQQAARIKVTTAP